MAKAPTDQPGAGRDEDEPRRPADPPQPPAKGSNKQKLLQLYESQGMKDEDPILNVQGIVLTVGDLR